VVVLTGEQKRVGQSKAEVKTGSVVKRGGEMECGSSGDARTPDKDGWPTWDGGDRWCTVTITSPRAVLCTRWRPERAV
jgi:hypothetical protein